MPMKTWLTKLRISNRLDQTDRAGTLSPSPSSRKGLQAEPHPFDRQLANLENQLKISQPAAPVVPAGMHSSIMRAVRAAAHEQAPQPRRQLNWSWLPAPAFALVLFLGILWSVQRTSVSPVRSGVPNQGNLTAVATSTLNLSQEVVRQVPNAAVAPLEKELVLLQSDLKRAAQFAMASIP